MVWVKKCFHVWLDQNFDQTLLANDFHGNEAKKNFNVGQPHDHIGWATSIPFASINTTNPRTNPWNFHKTILRIGGFENLSRLFWSFFKYFFLLHSLENQSVSWLPRLGRNFDQAKRDNTFWPRPNIMHPSVNLCHDLFCTLLWSVNVGNMYHWCKRTQVFELNKNYCKSSKFLCS